MNEAPIVFIHYGNSDYLPYTFKAARYFNPEKRVILLGDHTNKNFINLGVEHFQMEDYLTTEDVHRFKKVFKFISGEKFVGGEYWTQFNFLKMFALKNFLLENKIESIWIFDSDVLITESLKPHEYKFTNFDYSYHSDLLMPQGMINSIDFLEGITQFFIKSFADDQFIEMAKKEIDFKNRPQYGMTYMFFFKKYNETTNQKIVCYSDVVNGEYFNPLLYFDHGMKVYDIQPFKYKLKEVYFYPDGEIFVRKKDSGEFIKLITINLSWLPLFIIRRIYKQAMKFNGKKKESYNFKKLKTMHLNPNEWVRFKRRLKKFSLKGLNKRLNSL